jgi:hypothetical protein
MDHIGINPNVDDIHHKKIVSPQLVWSVFNAPNGLVSNSTRGIGGNTGAPTYISLNTINNELSNPY